MNGRAVPLHALLCYVNTVYTIMHGTRGVSLNNNPDSEVIERVWRTDGLIRRDYSSRFRLSSNIHHLSAGYRAASQSGYNVIIADDFDSL